MLDSFFFFVGGIQPKVKVLEETPRRCPRCGLHQAYLKRVDHYLSVFFIPVLKVKTGEPALVCDRCERTVSDSDAERFQARQTQPPKKACRFCGKGFPADYAFCPICGRRL
jgi:RNA polymerase subunit RPABC4/transcription elongation factor Spt4